MLFSIVSVLCLDDDNDPSTCNAGSVTFDTFNNIVVFIMAVLFTKDGDAFPLNSRRRRRSPEDSLCLLTPWLEKFLSGFIIGDNEELGSFLSMFLRRLFFFTFTRCNAERSLEADGLVLGNNDDVVDVIMVGADDDDDAVEMVSRIEGRSDVTMIRMTEHHLPVGIFFIIRFD